MDLWLLYLKEDYNLSIFPKAGENEPDYPAVSSGSDYPFQLSAGQVDRIMKEPAAFLQLPKIDPNKPEPEKIESK